MRSSMYQVHSDTEAETTPPRPTDTEFKWEWGMLPEVSQQADVVLHFRPPLLLPKL